MTDRIVILVDRSGHCVKVIHTPMPRVVPRGELRFARLKRLAARLESIKGRARRFPLSAAAVHPTFLEAGRALYESATRDFQPLEIRRALRSCPWLFVAAELERNFPRLTLGVHPNDESWSVASLVKYVEVYRSTLQTTAANEAAPAKARLTPVSIWAQAKAPGCEPKSLGGGGAAQAGAASDVSAALIRRADPAGNSDESEG